MKSYQLNEKNQKHAIKHLVIVTIMNNSLIVSQNNNKYYKQNPKTFENICIYYAFSTFIIWQHTYYDVIPFFTMLKTVLSNQVTIKIAKQTFFNLG